MPRYIIEGYYTDDPQVCSDLVDANSLEEAEAEIERVRGDDYTTDSGDELETRIANLTRLTKRPVEDIKADLWSLGVDAGTMCRTEGCDGPMDDGDGFDGWCPDCADLHDSEYDDEPDE